MGSMFDSDSKFMTVLSQIGDLIFLNLLWLVTSLPLVTLGASTAAMYAVVKPRGKGDFDSSVVRRYFRAFRQNLKKATQTFLVMLIPTLLVIVNCWLFLAGWLDGSIVRYVICALPCLLLVFAMDYLYPLIASFENSVLRCIGNAFALAVAHLPTTVILTVTNLLPLVLYLAAPTLFYRTLMIWIFIGFALIAQVNSFFLERVFDKYRP